VRTPELEAVRVALAPTFPEGRSDAPMLPDAYFEMATGRGVLKTPAYTLRISRECFEEHEPIEIDHALSILGYSGLLRQHRRLVLERGLGGADRAVVQWKGWRLVVGR
jgi:hypothetical protein